MTFAHLAYSDLMYLASASGVPGAESSPVLNRKSLMSGARSAADSSLLRRLMMGRGVPAATRKAFQLLASNPFKPASETVGTSGTRADRFAVVTASARVLPELMCEIELAAVAKISWMLPARRSIIAGPPPL